MFKCSVSLSQFRFYYVADQMTVPLKMFPGEESGNPLQYSCLDSLHGQRSLGGYSLGVAESDMTERLTH